MPYLYIYQQPVSESKAIGSNTSFTLLAKSEESYDWHWESKADAQSSWSTTDAGTELPSDSFFHMSDAAVYGNEDDPLPTIDPDEISLSIPVTAERNGHIYRCVLEGTNTVTSDEVTLTAVPAITITVQPQSQTIASGETATFSVTAEGENLSYQWQQYDTANSTWLDITNEINATLVINTVSSNETSTSKFRCKITNSTGTVYSDEATLTVLPEDAPAITTQPQSASIVEGNTATFIVEATGNGLSYQWEVSIDDGETWVGIRNATASSYSIQGSLSESGNKYRCTVSNTAGSVTSNAATLTVTEDTRLQPPVITANPSSTAVADGDTAVFTVTASGDGLSYQWQTNQNGSWYSISGATSRTYSIIAVTARNGSRYRCQVSNAAGTVYSSEAVLIITGGSSISTPTITSQPISTTVMNGSTGKFNIYAVGGSLTYQWQVKRNNTWYNVSGSTAPTLYVTGNAENNGKEYRCLVTNPSGNVYSNVAKLTVTDSGPISIYGYHSIIISGKNTFAEWQMYPTSRPHVAQPEVKTTYVDLPGADGGFDYTELLTKKPNYGYRKGSWEFMLIPQDRWAQVYRSLVNYLHGRQHTIVLEDDPDWQYTGRLTVNEWRSESRNSLITIDYVLEPEAVNTSGEEYNQDEEDLKAAGRLLRKPEHADSVIMLVNGVETIIPTAAIYEDGDYTLY